MPGDGEGPRRRGCGPEAQGWVQNHVGTHALRWEGVGHPLWAAACGVFGGQGDLKKMPQRKPAKKKYPSTILSQPALAPPTPCPLHQAHTPTHASPPRVCTKHTLRVWQEERGGSGEGDWQHGARNAVVCSSFLVGREANQQPPGRGCLFWMAAGFFFWVFGGWAARASAVCVGGWWLTRCPGPQQRHLLRVLVRAQTQEDLPPHHAWRKEVFHGGWQGCRVHGDFPRNTKKTRWERWASCGRCGTRPYRRYLVRTGKGGLTFFLKTKEGQ